MARNSHAAPDEWIDQRAGLRVLLVEDHEDTLRAMARLLRMNGHLVHTATCVRGALEAAASTSRLDLLISDIGLPDGSGCDLLRTLRRRSTLPGIAVTGHGEERYVRDCGDAGFDRHLKKPVLFTDLLATIDELRARPPAA